MMDVIRILIIEDEDTLAFLLKKMIENDIDGVSIEVKGDGKSGIEYVKNRGCDMVLLDMKLPDTNGIDILYEIKSISPTIEVILMTAYPDAELAIKGLTAGAYDYFTKPFSSGDIKKSITNAMDKIRLEREKDRLIEDLLKTNKTLTEINKELKRTKELVNQRLEIITHGIKNVNQFLDDVLKTSSGEMKELFAKIGDFLISTFDNIEYVTIFTKEKNYIISVESRGNPDIFPPGVTVKDSVFKEVVINGKEYVYTNIKGNKDLFAMPLYNRGKINGMIGMVLKNNVSDPFIMTICKLINIVIDNAELSVKMKRSYLEFLSLLIKSLEKQSEKFFEFLKGLGEVAANSGDFSEIEKSNIRVSSMLFGVSVISGNIIPNDEEEFIEMVKESYSMIEHIPAFDIILNIMENFINKKGCIYKCFGYMWDCYRSGKDILTCKKECKEKIKNENK